MRERLTVRRSGDRFVTRTPGIQTRHGFSFGPHYDPAHVAHGALVLHDEHRLDPGAGFDPHPHRDVVVVSWVLEGVLVHEQDGRTTRVPGGSLQRMVAGDGVLHTERAEQEPVRFLQLWLLGPGLERSYEVAAAPDEVGPVLGVLAGGLAAGGALVLPDVALVHLHVVEGEVELLGEVLGAGDAARLADAGAVTATARSSARLLVVDAVA